jgi:hypothetical protein
METGLEGQVKLSRFSAIIDAYGAEPTHWPERERDDVLALSRSSVLAARALARARELDSVLRDGDPLEIDIHPARFAQLHARIMAGIQNSRKSWLERVLGMDLAPARLWPSLAGMAVATILGIAVGMSGLMQLDTNGETDDLVVSSIDMPAAAE